MGLEIQSWCSWAGVLMRLLKGVWRGGDKKTQTEEQTNFFKRQEKKEPKKNSMVKQPERQRSVTEAEKRTHFK